MDNDGKLAKLRKLWRSKNNLMTIAQARENSLWEVEIFLTIKKFARERDIEKGT